MTLRCHGVRLVHGTRAVLDGVELELRPGTVTLLAGRNGSGKSTLLRVLSGLTAPHQGTVELDGVPIASLAPRTRALRLGLVPQQVDCPFEFTGRELVELGRHPHRGAFGPLSAADRQAVESAIAAVDAAAFADRAVTTLSGGELRRIAVARALATQASILLLDEPTANLDVEHALQLGQLLTTLAAQGATLLVASHDLNLLGPCAHEVLLLHGGRIAHRGPPEQALTVESVEAVFGVRIAPPSGFFPRDFRPLGPA